MEHVRTKQELLVALAEQREFLRRSSLAYDDGQISEAKRLASTIFILFHDGSKRTKSLITQLGLRDRLKFISTAQSIGSDTLPKTALAFMSVRSSGEVAFFPNFYQPRLRDHQCLLPASKWWDEPVYRAIGEPDRRSLFGEGRTISRRNLVFHLRSQDGGAHVDGALKDQAYVDLALRSGTGIEIINPDGSYRPVPFPHLATMRQIAWEVEQSLLPVSGGPEIPPPPDWEEGEDSVSDLNWKAPTLSAEAVVARQKAKLQARYPHLPPEAISIGRPLLSSKPGD